MTKLVSQINGQVVSFPSAFPVRYPDPYFRFRHIMIIIME